MFFLYHFNDVAKEIWWFGSRINIYFGSLYDG